MTKYRNGFLAIALLTITSSAGIIPAQASAKAVPIKTPVKSGIKTIALPDAYPGMSYNTTVNPGVSALKAPAVCVPVPALPAWLKLDCSDGTFKFAGTVPAVTKDTPVAAAMTVIDANNKQYSYALTLTLRPTVETMPLGQAVKATPETLAPSKVDYDKMALIQTIPIQEGGLQAAGQISNVPAGAKLSLQIWATQDGQPPAQMQLVNPSAPPATVPQVDLKSGAYSIQFQQTLAAGQSLQVKLFAADGSQVKAFDSVPLSSAIDIGTMRLKIEEPIVAGSKTISGTLSGLPNPVIKPVAASGSNPATYGNLPGIVVWVTDPASGGWSQVIPAVGVTPYQFLSVNADSGSFTVTLPNALVARQQVRVDVVHLRTGHSPALPHSILRLQLRPRRSRKL